MVPPSVEVDLDGNPRIINGTVDMGAYEAMLLAVAVDIKPGSCPNPLNVASRGVLPVAILGSEDFDVNIIQVASIRLARVAPIRNSYEDVTIPITDGNECECTADGPDGFTDLTLLVAYLRPSKIDAAKHSRVILKLLVRRFRQVWPDVKIIFRGDSSFCRWRLLRWCDRHNVYYIVGLAKNPVLERLGQSWIKQAQEKFQQSKQKQRIFGEFEYAAATWDRKHRVIIKAEHLQQGSNTRFVVTDLCGGPQHLYDDIYCPRGDMENRIKEQQLHLFADRTSCHDFLANQFRVLLSAAAYILVEHLRHEHLAGTELANAQVNTIRLKLFKIGARVIWSLRRIVFHLASGYPLKELFMQIVTRLKSTLQPSLVFR